MTVSQQTIGGNSCGACATSYAVQELKNEVLGIPKIKALYTLAQFNSKLGHHQIAPNTGVFYDHIDPTRLQAEIAGTFKLKCTAHRAAGSSLNKIDPLLSNAAIIKKGEGLDLIKQGKKLAIAIYNNGSGLHYVLTKYESGRFWIKDSNAKFPEYQAAPFFIRVNQSFVADLNVSGLSPQKNTYTYLGACLVVFS